MVQVGPDQFLSQLSHPFPFFGISFSSFVAVDSSWQLSEARRLPATTRTSTNGANHHISNPWRHQLGSSKLGLAHRHTSMCNALFLMRGFFPSRAKQRPSCTGSIEPKQNNESEVACSQFNLPRPSCPVQPGAHTIYGTKC